MLGKMNNVKRELSSIGLDDTSNTIEIINDTNETIEVIDSVNGSIQSPSRHIIDETFEETNTTNNKPSQNKTCNEINSEKANSGDEVKYVSCSCCASYLDLNSFFSRLIILIIKASSSLVLI